MLRLIGYKKGERKSDSRKYCVLYAEKNFPEWDINRGAQGNCFVEIWLWGNAGDNITPKNIGCEFEEKFERGSNGKPEVVAVVFDATV